MLRRVGGSAVVLACLLGCASGKSALSTASSVPQSAAPTIESIAGTHGLVAIDGHPLPFAPRTRGQAANAAWAVVSGTLALKADGTFRIETTYDTRASSEQTAFAFSGTCYAEGNEVRMVWDGGGLTNLTSRGDTLVLKNDGTLFSYVRR